jgi:hypothetical protein
MAAKGQPQTKRPNSLAGAGAAVDFKTNLHAVNELKLRSTILRLPTWKAISGLVEDWNAMGDDMEKGVMLKPGSVFVLPANHIHHTWTTDEGVILQIYFTGPGGIAFINPADDPRKKAQ